MTKLSAIALAAALALTGPALALDTTVKAGGTAAAGTGAMGTEVDATATSSLNADAYGSLISTLNAGKGMVDLKGIGADAQISVVGLNSIKANGDPKALDNALEKNASTATSLQASINANADLKAKLESQGVDIADVVAITTAADGMLTVYVDDRA